MILIKDTTEILTFNKDYNFITNYVSGTTITGVLVIENKTTNLITTFDFSTTDITANRYFDITISSELTDISQGMYKYQLNLNNIVTSGSVEFDIGILVREIKAETGTTYTYTTPTSASTVYVYGK